MGAIRKAGPRLVGLGGFAACPAAALSSTLKPLNGAMANAVLREFAVRAQAPDYSATLLAGRSCRLRALPARRPGPALRRLCWPPPPPHPPAAGCNRSGLRSRGTEGGGNRGRRVGMRCWALQKPRGARGVPVSTAWAAAPTRRRPAVMIGRCSMDAVNQANSNRCLA